MKPNPKSPQSHLRPCFGILALSVMSAHAATLQVDIQNASATSGSPLPTTQSGWTAWATTASSFSTTPQTNSFTYAPTTGGNLGVSLTPTHNAGARNYGIENVTSGTLTNPNVWADLYFMNNLDATALTTASMTVNLTNLVAGQYQFTSYHYADNLATANNDQGTASVFLSIAGGTFTDTGSDVTLTVGGITSATTSRNLSATQVMTAGTFTTYFTVANDNDPISIRYQNITGGDTFGINGFELTQVPEPSAALLGGLGFLYLLRRRRQ